MKNYTITVNGNVYDVIVEEGRAGAAAPVQRAAVPAAAPVQRAAAPAAAPVQRAAAPAAAPVQSAAAPAPMAAPANTGSQGNVKVLAPMPGKILAVKASAGQAVKMGDVILVLEAMKMENEIVAPQDGTIASINVSENATVEAGDVLATLN